MAGEDQPEPANVENPMIGYLRSLKSSLESSLADVPDIDTPTGSVGSTASWTGTRADTVHSDLAAIAATLRSCLTELPGDVQDAIDAVHPEKVTATMAKVIRIDLGYY